MPYCLQHKDYELTDDLKIAVMGGQNTDYGRNQTCNMPSQPEQWQPCLEHLKSNNISCLLILPPLKFHLTQTSSVFNCQPDEAKLMPWLQEEYEAGLGGAASLAGLAFCSEDFTTLAEAEPLNYNQASLCRQRLDERRALNQGASWWAGNVWRGRLCRQRLAMWRQLAPEQRKLELNLLAQVAVVLLALSLLGLWLAGTETLGWLLILLLYPLNRPFIRMAADKYPQKVTGCLAFCLLRPLIWLAGLVSKNVT